MKLLMSPASPFVRKVRVLLREAGQTDAVQEVAVAANPMDTPADLVAANPLGKIPALIREDGPALYDSRVITRYLDTKFNAGFYPEHLLWEVLTLEATGDAICEAGVGVVYEQRHRPPELQMPEWMDAQWQKISRALDTLETRWISHLKGPVDMGQIAVGCALAYLDLRHDARNWRQGRPELAAWEADFAQRPSMQATRPA